MSKGKQEESAVVSDVVETKPHSALSADFTPGPWSVHPSGTVAEYDVMTDDGFYVAQTFEMYGACDEVVTLANALLIAAAPALYEAASNALIVLLQTNKPDDYIDRTVSDLQSALALATKPDTITAKPEQPSPRP